MYSLANPSTCMCADDYSRKLGPGESARAHRPREIDQIARSIVEFSFIVPILVGASDKVIAGRGRLLAARQLGWRDVPTIELHHLSEA